MAIPASDHAGEPGGTPIFQRLLAEAPTTAIRSLTDASAAPPPAPTTATRLLTDASPAAPTTATRRLLTGASAARVTATAAGARGAAQRFLYRKVEVATGPPGAELTPTQEISLHDITPQIRALIAESGVTDGVVHCVSQHTTTALTINEMETRLVDDVRDWLFSMAPPDAKYTHNDLHLRPASEEDRARIDRNWMSQDKGTLEEFMAQEPINAHSHLLSMLLGASESIPVADGELCLGQWQSVVLVDLDGPRARTVGIQVSGNA